MVILIVYLTPFCLFRYLHLFIYVNIFFVSLGVFDIFLWSSYWTKYVDTHEEAATGRSSTK